MSTSNDLRNGLKSGLRVLWGDQGEVLVPLDILALNWGQPRPQKLKAKVYYGVVRTEKKSCVGALTCFVKGLSTSNDLRNSLKSGLRVLWGDQGEVLAPLDILALNWGHPRPQKPKAKVHYAVVRT